MNNPARIVLPILALLLISLVYFWPERPNPLIGRWVADEPIYGRLEVLEFTRFGLLESGSHIPAEYDVSSKKVKVITGKSSDEYVIVTKDIIKQRVPRTSWRFYSREGSPAEQRVKSVQSQITRF